MQGHMTFRRDDSFGHVLLAGSCLFVHGISDCPGLLGM